MAPPPKNRIIWGHPSLGILVTHLQPMKKQDTSPTVVNPAPRGRVLNTNFRIGSVFYVLMRVQKFVYRTRPKEYLKKHE